MAERVSRPLFVQRVPSFRRFETGGTTDGGSLPPGMMGPLDCSGRQQLGVPDRFSPDKTSRKANFYLQPLAKKRLYAEINLHRLQFGAMPRLTRLAFGGIPDRHMGNVGVRK